MGRHLLLLALICLCAVAVDASFCESYGKRRCKRSRKCRFSNNECLAVPTSSPTPFPTARPTDSCGIYRKRRACRRRAPACKWSRGACSVGQTYAPSAPTDAPPSTPPPPPTIDEQGVCALRTTRKACQKKNTGTRCIWNEALEECYFRRWRSPCERGRPLHGTEVCDEERTEGARVASLLERIPLDDKLKMLEYQNNGSPSLGIGWYDHWSEALHGLGGSMHSHHSCGESLKRGVKFVGETTHAVSFPQVISQASSFNRRLFRSVAAAISREARAFANEGNSGLGFFAPNVNLARDPRWGRTQEVPGEDPRLNAVFAEAFVRGLQEGDVDEETERGFLRAGACCKHLTAYSVEGSTERDYECSLSRGDPNARSCKFDRVSRHNFDAAVDRRDLEESYLLPFEGCVERGGATCIMCSYSAINGVPLCANRELLTDVARGDWGFEGFVVTDCGGMKNLRGFGYGGGARAIENALAAGTDMDCTPHSHSKTFFAEHLKGAFAKGAVTESQIDASVGRVLSQMFRLGMFANEMPYAEMRYDTHANTPEHEALALRAANEGMVLLKNTAGLALPLSATTTKRIVIVGPMATAEGPMLGNYHGCVRGVVSVASALKELAPQRGHTVEVAPRPGYFNRAMSSALARADVVVAVVGLGQNQENEANDRETITLPNGQTKLISDVLRDTAGSPQAPSIILVVLSGGSVDLAAYASHDRVAAILWAGIPGMFGGTSVAETLLGDNVPSGRLTQTFYQASFTDECHFLEMAFRPSTLCPSGRGYRFFTGDAVYPFGTGLSYTDFSVEFVSSTPNQRRFQAADLDTLLASRPLHEDVLLTLRVQVVNVGAMFDGARVVLAFVRSPNAGVGGVPLRTLADFERTDTLVKGGGSEVVELRVRARDLGIVGDDGTRRAVPGTWIVDFEQFQVEVNVQ